MRKRRKKRVIWEDTGRYGPFQGLLRAARPRFPRRVALVGVTERGQQHARAAACPLARTGASCVQVSEEASQRSRFGVRTTLRDERWGVTTIERERERESSNRYRSFAGSPYRAFSVERSTIALTLEERAAVPVYSCQDPNREFSFRILKCRRRRKAEEGEHVQEPEKNPLLIFSPSRNSASGHRAYSEWAWIDQPSSPSNSSEKFEYLGLGTRCPFAGLSLSDLCFRHFRTVGRTPGRRWKLGGFFVRGELVLDDRVRPF